MEYSAREIAYLINGTVEGNPDLKVTRLSKIEEGTPGSLSFVANTQYIPYIYTTNSSVVLVAMDLVLEKPIKDTCTLIRVENPRESFAKMLEICSSMRQNVTGIEEKSQVSKTAKLGENVYIGSFSYIGSHAVIGNNVKIYPNVFIGENSIIGDNTILFPGVKIYHSCLIGRSCTFHSGVVIGSDGFGFEPNTENNYKKIPHLGNVIIEDHVEIGSNTTIDRATLGSTIIRKGVKMDNLIQIGHNAEIGENTIIVAQTGIAGSTKIGKNCIIAGQVGIVGHITIADGVKIAAQSGVGSSITEKNAVVQGSPAFTIGDYKRSYVLFKNLPDIHAKIKELEKFLQELKQSVDK